jgi:hypothetical protein
MTPVIYFDSSSKEQRQSAGGGGPGGGRGAGIIYIKARYANARRLLLARKISERIKQEAKSSKAVVDHALFWLFVSPYGRALPSLAIRGTATSGVVGERVVVV